ncbi:RDD family protein [Streptomyces sp. NPDC017086]|uniref:RDD family protein n=2 Tax=unclassified Streptomyces TaxID=2593676 RepID=UPI0037B8FF97
MSAPTPAPGDDRPREGYYPDPSIPGYVRYWNGASWVPGTSRPAPRDGEPLSPPSGVHPAVPSVEETGPHFFDEDPPALDGRLETGHPEPAARADGTGSPGPWTRASQAVQAGRPAPAGQAAQGAQWSRSAQPAGYGADAAPAGARGADPRVPAQGPGAAGQGTARTDGTAAPADGGGAPDPGTFVFRRPVPGPAAAPADDGTLIIRPVPADPAGPPGAGSGPAAGFGPQGPAGAPAHQGFGAGKAAAARAAAAQTPPAASAPQPPPVAQPAPGAAVPQQAGPVQGAAPVTPLTTGPGGGQASWAQQVHQLAGGGDEQPLAPWKPPVEDLFQAAARRQAAARPAGLGRRCAARLIDLLVVGAVTAAAAVPLGLRAADHVQQKIDAARLSGHEVTVWLVDGQTGTSLGIVLAVLLLAGVLYEVLPTAKWGRTLGKRVCGLEVRDIEGHEPPAFGPALRRWLVFSVPGLLVVGIVGVLWCLFDRPWHQCWHDKAAHTFVAG